MNNFGDLHYILAISLQFSAIFLCFSTVFLHFGHFLGVSRQLFAYFSQFKDQLNWTNNHIRISLIFPKYIKCHFRHFYLFIYLYTYVSPHFACSSWGDHDNDQCDQNWSWYPECSLFGIHIVLDIRYMTNDSNLGVYIGTLGFSMTFVIISLVLVADIWQLWQICLYFETHFLEFKMVLDQKVWIGAWCWCFN